MYWTRGNGGGNVEAVFSVLVCMVVEAESESLKENQGGMEGGWQQGLSGVVEGEKMWSVFGCASRKRVMLGGVWL